MYGAELYAYLQKIKQIFDPYAPSTPASKFGTSLEENLQALVRTDYSLDHLYDHLPRS